MSEHLNNQPTNIEAGSELNYANQDLIFRSEEQSQTQNDPNLNISQDDDNSLETQSAAQKKCREQMDELLEALREQDGLPEQAKEAVILEAQQQIEKYMSRFKHNNQSIQQVPEDQDQNDFPEALPFQNQSPMLSFQPDPALLKGMGDQLNINPIAAQLMGDLANANQYMQNPNINPEEYYQYFQEQKRMLDKQKMSSQLQIFYRKFMKKLPQRAKKRLETKSRQYMDQCFKDYNRNKKQNQQQPNSGSVTTFDQTFESTADPNKYLGEIEGLLKKHPDLQENFQRFQQKHMELESEQITIDFVTTYPQIFAIWQDLALLYNQYETENNRDNMKIVGQQIFHHIIPFAKSFDPRIMQFIPQAILDQFSFKYDEEGCLEAYEQNEIQANSSSEEESSNSQENSSSDRSNTMNRNNLSQPSVIIDSSQQDDDDISQLQPNIEGGDQRPVIPAYHLKGKHKSLIQQLNIQYPNSKAVNQHDKKQFDNFFKSLKDEKDWDCFCKIFYLYFEGVLNLTEFFKLFEDKFQTKIKMDVKEEIQKLLPTRDSNRRMLSNLLKPWNDIENQKFELLPNSSYYKIEEGFPIPTCTGKMLDEIYHGNINDQYLSLATGSENFKFKFRNTNEEQIYKTEDKMYELDTQIDNIERSQEIIRKQCDEFDQLSEADQAKYKFPTHLLSPLRYYWDQRFRKQINEVYFDKGKTIKAKEMMNLKKTFNDKLEFLRNQKASSINDHKDNFRKNFTKSLDHKSFQYKDFMNKFLKKQNNSTKIKQISDDYMNKNINSDHQVRILYGSGEQPATSNYKYFNSFGKDFAGQFDQRRLQFLKEKPDHPIDMNFMDNLSLGEIKKIQAKCPQVRFIMNDKLTFNITLKLVIQSIKQSNQNEKDVQIDALRFILCNFLQIDNFETIDEESNDIQQLSNEMVEILMNSATYYQKKYNGELGSMCEVYSLESLKQNQSSPSSTEQQQKQNNSINLNQNQSDQKQLFEEIKVAETEDLDLEKQLFIPSFSQKNQYKLFYGPFNIYMFLKFFYSVYERILKAQDLVKSKVEQDFKDDFSHNQWSSKFQEDGMQILIDERFQYLIKAVITVMSQGNVLDSNKYEDVARELLGAEAYLLFQMDKLVNNCQKQLLNYSADVSCQASQKLYNQFQSQKTQCERLYLSSFHKVANEISNTQAVIGTTKDKIGTHGGNNPNRDNLNLNMGSQAFRFLYSPQSNILSIHQIVLNPFQVKKDGQNPLLDRQEEDFVKVLQRFSSKRNQDEETKGEVQIINKFDMQSQPVFLKRNLRVMKTIRKKENHQISQKNGLVCNVIPKISQLQFDQETEDVLKVQRAPIKVGSKRRFSEMKKDLIMQSSARNQIKTRFKNLGLDLDISQVEESPIIPKSSDKKRATRSTTS